MASSSSNPGAPSINVFFSCDEYPHCYKIRKVTLLQIPILLLPIWRLVAVQTSAQVRLKVLGGKECQERRRADGVDMLLLDKKVSPAYHRLFLIAIYTSLVLKTLIWLFLTPRLCNSSSNGNFPIWRLSVVKKWWSHVCYAFGWPGTWRKAASLYGFSRRKR